MEQNVFYALIVSIIVLKKPYICSTLAFKVTKKIMYNLLFSCIFILSKLLLNSKNVLYITIMWTISSSIGFFIRKSVDATNKGILFGIILKLLIAMVIFIFVAPIVRLLLGITQLSKILLKNILEPLNQ